MRNWMDDPIIIITYLPISYRGMYRIGCIL